MNQKLDALSHSTGFPSLTLQSFAERGMLPITSPSDRAGTTFNGLALLTSIEEVYRG